ncbi:MAG: 3-deoxy-7-phosphoheptulonate synthase [Proteobacteria bacterium]|nr:3-deoxy-7-phosphoheptulonate synthase [Pseudomonadota bacterium]
MLANLTENALFFVDGRVLPAWLTAAAALGIVMLARERRTRRLAFLLGWIGLFTLALSPFPFGDFAAAHSLDTWRFSVQVSLPLLILGAHGVDGAARALDRLPALAAAGGMALWMGLATATEFLEPITPQYIADTIVLGAIGARTTESPTHRQMASGLSMPVGFKNSTDGSLQAAVEAMQAARAPHSFMGIDDDGGTAIVSTTGNPWGVLMLRGGRSGSNYSPDVMQEARRRLEAAGLPVRVIVDCSHANSGKDPRRQSIVWRDVLAQRVAGDRSIVGMMLESNINAGSQEASADRSKLAYGVSITDGCIGWEETEELLLEAHSRLA